MLKIYSKKKLFIIRNNIIYKSFSFYTDNLTIVFDDLYKHKIWNYF